MTDAFVQYEYISNGGCVRCDAMHGRLSDKEPMPRPHPNCTCQIVKRDFGLYSQGQCDESRMRYEFLNTSPVYHSIDETEDDEFDMVYTFRIHCPDGETMEVDVSVSVTFGAVYGTDFAVLDEVFAEALELVEELAASECAPCPDPPAIV